VIGSASVVVALSSPALADPTSDARDAEALAAAGQFAKAATRFRAAYAGNPEPKLICNAGVAYYKARDFPRAHYYLGRCLAVRDHLDAAFVTSLTKAVAAVTKKLEADHWPRIELAPEPASAAISITGASSPFDEPVVAGTVWVPPGHYTITFRAPGYDDKSREVDVKLDQTITENVQLAAATAPRAEPTAPPVTTVAPTTTVPPTTTVAPTSPMTKQPETIAEPPSKLPAIVATAATAAAAIAAVSLYVIARGHVDDARVAAVRADYDAAVDAATSDQHLSWILGGVAGAGAIVSGFLWYRASTAPVVEVRSGGAVVGVAGRF